MKRQTDFFKKRELYYERRSWGRSSSDRQVHWWRDETVGRHTEPLHQRESSVLLAPAPGTAIKNRLIPMNKHPAMNDDSIVMDSAVPSVERNHASLLRAVMRRKRVKMNRKRFKARRFLKTVPVHTSTVHSDLEMSPMSDEIMSDTQLILRAIEVIPGAFIRRSGRRWRKTTAFSSESSSPENSDLVLTSDQISPHLSGIEQEKMDQGCEDSVCKCKILSNKLKSLKYLINQITNANYCKEKFYLEEKYNHIFNRFLKKILKVDVDKSNQFAFVIFIKKDGSYDKDVWDNKSNTTEKCPEVYKPKGTNKHSEDDIFDLLKEILSKSDCPYKEALDIFFK
ncbi:uncharacterized protein LOC125275979 [Megalobrama amblycephala]|uniref:uncharacterized protein LOC125275979 n=1 Tax=Megalobrama amblycephala TaxID=75352 RepID=UPI002013EB0C|nr:uncharacterized protein LOC125275979 [Megalobrama amblycephala]